MDKTLLRAHRRKKSPAGGVSQIPRSPTKRQKKDPVSEVQLPRTSISALYRNGENAGLSLYIRQATEFQLITPERERELAPKIQAGNQEALEELISANLRLVMRIAGEYKDYGLPFLDLINEGNIGLMKAALRFDPAKGAKFSTYAVWWIKQGIKRALSNQAKMIRIPIHKVQRLSKFKLVRRELEAETGEVPSLEDIALEMGADLEEIQELFEIERRQVSSLDAPIGTDSSGSSMLDILPDESLQDPTLALQREEDQSCIDGGLNQLTSRERAILTQRFGLNGGDVTTLEQIGVSFGVTRERIRQLEGAALRKLRFYFKTKSARVHPEHPLHGLEGF